MRALTVQPMKPNSLQLSRDVEPPVRGVDQLLVQSGTLGVCGTDMEIAHGKVGEAPGREQRLIIGHESLGRVLAAPEGSSFRRGDLVVGVVRRPDARPCPCCAAGEWDMCMNGEYTERGIRGAHGFGSELFTLAPEFAVPVPDPLHELGVLIEPASIVAKAWEQIDRIAARSGAIALRSVLVTGAGPVGLLACLFAVQRGHDVTVIDELDHGIKPDLVRSCGARYHAGSVESLSSRADIVLECTGSERVISDVLGAAAPNGIVCLLGVSSAGHSVSLSAAALNNTLVMDNQVVFGSVNANMRHYASAVRALLAGDPRWLKRLITRTVALSDYAAAFEAHDGDVKTVIDMTR